MDEAKEAEPLASDAVPRIAPPSRNCTVPVAVAGLTVATNVIAAPTNAGFDVEVTAVTVVVLALTVCDAAADVELVLLASPL